MAAASSSQPSGRWMPRELPATVAYPATKSSESPGRKNATRMPISKKSTTITPRTPKVDSRCDGEIALNRASV